MKKILFLFIATSLGFSCAPDEIFNEGLNRTVSGSWLYVEYGYSPGDKYHTVPVSPVPPSTLTLKGDSTMSSTNMTLDKYRYYRIVKDTLTGRQVIGFFEDDPGNKPLDLAGLSPIYSVSWEGNQLILNYRWCIEGCHMKFKRISLAEEQ